MISSRFIVSVMLFAIVAHWPVQAQTIDVWPGDVNNDGIANNLDVIYLGVGFNQQGPARDSSLISWGAQQAPPWNGFINSFSVGPNLTFADCDGSGFINQSDLEAIKQNYNLTHRAPDTVNFVTGGPTDPPLFIINQPDSVSAGDTVQLRVALGNDGIPANGFFGIAFSITYDTMAVKSASAIAGADIAGPGMDPLFLAKTHDSAGRMDVALSLKANSGGTVGGGITFEGDLLIVSLVIEDNLFGMAGAPAGLMLHFADIKTLNYNLEDIAVYANNASIPFKTTIASARQLNENYLKVYPNPTSSQLNITGLVARTQVSIIDLTGTAILQAVSEGTQLKLDTGSLPAGMYLLHLSTEAGTITRKIAVHK